MYMKIFYVLIGVWNPRVPQILEKVKKHNETICPSFQHHVYQAHDVQHLLGDDTWNYLHANITRKVAISDIARYYIMWIHGGFYFDIDVCANVDLKPLIDLCVQNKKRILLFTEHDNADPNRMGPKENKMHTRRIYNCMFWSEPKEDFWKQCYDLALARVKTLHNVHTWTDEDILWATGPDVVTTVFHSSTHDSIQIINYSNTQTFLTHLRTGTWKGNADSKKHV